jgi:hypothetical protein
VYHDEAGFHCGWGSSFTKLPKISAAHSVFYLPVQSGKFLQRLSKNRILPIIAEALASVVGF